MGRASSKPIKTFSIAFGHDDFDESGYARIVAKKFGTEHHELGVEPNILETVETLTRSLEEPFGDSSMLPTYHVCRMARKYVTVALSGDGGDELFAGYDRYALAMKRRELNWVPQGVGNFYRRHIHPRVPSGMYGRNRAWNVLLSTRDRYLDDVSDLPALHREQSIFSEDFLATAARLPDPLGAFQNFYDHA